MRIQPFGQPRLGRILWRAFQRAQYRRGRADPPEKVQRIGHRVLAHPRDIGKIHRFERDPLPPGSGQDVLDVLRIGKRVFVGVSARSNAEGRAQLRALLAPFGYTVTDVATRDCLHLKSAVTQVVDDTVLINPAWLADASPFTDYTRIEVDPAEEHAANAVRVGTALLYPDCFPKTLQRLRDAGIAVTTVDVSELQKAEGAVTCCSVLLNTTRAA